MYGGGGGGKYHEKKNYSHLFYLDTVFLPIYTLFEFNLSFI